MSKIIVVGSINIDLVARVGRLPSEGETIHGRSFSTIPGGKGANQAVAAARLGAEVAMVGRLGQDSFAAPLRGALTEAGVETSAVLSVPGPSGSAIITVTDAGANAIIVIPGANGELTPSALEQHRDTLQGASVVLTQLETPLPTIECLAALTAELHIPLILDPAPAQPLPPSILGQVTWLTPNESETCTLLRALGAPCGESLSPDQVPAAAEHLLATGVRNVALKLGSRGVYLHGADVQPTSVPTFPVQAVDTTAAGDAFNGGFSFALYYRGLPPAQAARFACATASISVTRPGAQPAMPTLADVEDFLRQNHPA